MDTGARLLVKAQSARCGRNLLMLYKSTCFFLQFILLSDSLEFNHAARVYLFRFCCHRGRRRTATRAAVRKRAPRPAETGGTIRNGGGFGRVCGRMALADLEPCARTGSERGFGGAAPAREIPGVRGRAACHARAGMGGFGRIEAEENVGHCLTGWGDPPRALTARLLELKVSGI